MGDTDIIAAHFLQQTDVATVRGYTYRCLILMTVETCLLYTSAAFYNIYRCLKLRMAIASDQERCYSHHTPVSYTHLDVYKRQAQTSLQEAGSSK